MLKQEKTKEVLLL